MLFVSEELPAEDDGRRPEIYVEIDDDEEGAIDYQELMKAILKFNFSNAEDMKNFEKVYMQYFPIKNQAHGTFLHYWAKSSLTDSPPPNFGKWLFSKWPSMIKEVDKDKRTAIHSALDRKSADAQKFLALVVKECPRATLVQVLAQKDVGGNNCLHHAILRTSPFTRELIEICQSQSEKHLFTAGNNEEQTPLHLAMVPPRAKQQRPKFTSSQQVDVQKAVPSDTRRMSINKGGTGNKEERGQNQSKKPEPKDKETTSRTKGASGIKKVDASEPKNRNDASKEPGGPITSGAEQGSGDPPIISSSASFPFQDVVQDLMKYGREALWKADSKKMTPYRYRQQQMSVKRNLTVEDDAVSRAVSEDPVIRDMKEFCLRNLGRGDAMKSLYEKGKGMRSSSTTYLSKYILCEKKISESANTFAYLKIEKHLEFDLSGIPNLSISRSDLDRLARHLTFEETLQYVAIPRLRVDDAVTEKLQPLPSPVPEHQDESNGSKLDSKARPARDCAGLKDAGIIFEWLEKMKVRRIFKVIVIDDGDPAHSNQVIEESLRGFKIETWDWKKVDICSDTIFEAASVARFVNLYSSGNSAVLKGWSGPDGLVKLKLVWKPIFKRREGFTNFI